MSNEDNVEKRQDFREYLKENSQQVSAWPSWMKDGAYGVSVAKTSGQASTSTNSSPSAETKIQD